MKDNFNDIVPDGVQDKNDTLNEILSSVDSRLPHTNSVSDWENEINSVIEKRSHKSEIEDILNEYSPKEKKTDVPQIPEPEAPQNDVQELVEQITVGKKVSELSHQKKMLAGEPVVTEEVSEVKEQPEIVPSENILPENIPEVPSVSSIRCELPTAEISLNDIKSRTLVYNLSSRKTPVSMVRDAVEKSPVAQVRKPVKKMVRVDSSKPHTPPAPHKDVRKSVTEQSPASVKPEMSVPAKKKSVKEKFIDLFPQKKDPMPEKVRKVVFMCSILAIIVCGYMVGDYYIDLWKSKNLHQEIATIYEPYPAERKVNVSTIYEPDYERTYTMLDGARKLLDMNPDVVGYITIPDTPIANPVMQSGDNKKYLDQNINGDQSRAGEIFLDYRNNFDRVQDGKLSVANSDNLVIYGHNMKNDEMFGCLKYYQRNYDYYNQHPVIYLNSNYECYTYKIFSYFILDALDESETAYDCWNKFDFDGEEDFYNFVNEAKKRSLGLNDVDVKYGDKLVTLSTCNTVLGDRGRLIVMGRLLRDGEDVKKGTDKNVQNANVKWPSIYYQQKPNEKYNPDAEFIPYG